MHMALSGVDDANGRIGGNYYSFPSFEGFQDFLEDEERLDQEQDEGVP